MLSVVVPVHNEQDNIRPLIEEIMAIVPRVPISEMVFVDDQSRDDTLAVLKNLKSEFPMLRALHHEKQSGQSAATWTGVRAAKFPVVVTLDGDGQNPPAEIEKLYKLYKSQTRPVMVMGERAKREDSALRRIISRLANKIRAALLQDGTRDTGCSLKMFRREDYLNLPYFNHMHRYIPALMIRDGVAVMHVPVSHRPRVRGVSKYGTLDRLMNSLSDLMGVFWLMRRRRAPGAVREE